MIQRLKDEKKERQVEKCLNYKRSIASHVPFPVQDTWAGTTFCAITGLHICFTCCHFIKCIWFWNLFLNWTATFLPFWINAKKISQRLLDPWPSLGKVAVIDERGLPTLGRTTNPMCWRKGWRAESRFIWSAWDRHWVWNWYTLVSNYTNFWERWDFIWIFGQVVYIEHIINSRYQVKCQTL